MQPRSPKLLEDIRDAAAFIREATRGSEAEKFRNNRLLRQAVERNFEIIGEAVRRIDREDPKPPAASPTTATSSHSETSSATATTSSIRPSSGAPCRTISPRC